MIWFFHKGTEIRLETRFDSAVGDYVAEVHYPDGRHQTERFSDEHAFRGYLLDLARRLSRERWQQRSSARSSAARLAESALLLGVDSPIAGS